MNADQLTAKTVFTPAELARAGWNVYRGCLGMDAGDADWEKEEVAWVYAAQRTEAMINEAMEAEAPMNRMHMASGIYGWLVQASGSNTAPAFLTLADVVKQAFVSVFTVLWSLKTTEEPDIDEAQRTAVDWYRATLARKNGVVASNPLAEPEAPALPKVPTGNVSSSPLPPPKQEDVPISKPKSKGRAAAGFKAALLTMRDHYIEKAARLEQFAAKIDDEDDEVLTEVFHALMSE